MTATVTTGTYRIAWNAGDDGPHAIAFDARLQVRDDGTLQRWNGFLCPFLDRAQVERYIAWTDGANAALPGLTEAFDRVRFDGDTLVYEPRPEYAEDGEAREEPTMIDGRPHYAFGSFGWTWQFAPDVPLAEADAWQDAYERLDATAETDAARVAGIDRELSLDEAEAFGFDGTGRDGDPRFPYHVHDVPA